MTAIDTALVHGNDDDQGTLARLRWAATDCWTIVLQELTHLLRQPSMFAWQIGTPVVMVLMFVYVFGSAMDVTGQGAGVGYVDFAMPGLFVMTMAFRVHEHRLCGDSQQGEGLHGPVPVHADVAVRRGDGP